MKRSFIFFLFSTLFLTACRQKKNFPSGILPPEKMEAVLWDMLRSDQFLATYVLPVDTSADKDTEHINLYRQVLAKHAISRDVFQQSFTYYKNHPGLLKVIMDSISHQPQVTSQPPPVTPVTDEVAPLDPVPLLPVDTSTVPLRKINPKKKMRN